MEHDSFFRKGREYARERKAKESAWRRARHTRSRDREARARRDIHEELELLEGRLKREELKDVLFEFLEEM